jgi:hypothetical protein
MSGDAESGTGNFTMNGGTLTAEEGPLLYSTNTQSVIYLKGVLLFNPSGILLKASAGDWGTSGSNGAEVTFTADDETLNGDIICDDISAIILTLANNTTLNGGINSEHTAKSVALTVDKTSVWEVTADSYVTSFTDEDVTLSNIHSNGHTIYYDASNNANSWLNGNSYELVGGGQLTPAS